MSTKHHSQGKSEGWFQGNRSLLDQTPGTALEIEATLRNLFLGALAKTERVNEQRNLHRERKRFEKRINSVDQLNPLKTGFENPTCYVGWWAFPLMVPFLSTFRSWAAQHSSEGEVSIPV